MAETTPPLLAIVSELQSPELIYIDVVKELSKNDLDIEGFVPDDYIRVTHPSPSGNRAIAEVILAALEDHFDAASKAN